MADTITVYQCPNCNGPLHYDAKLQKLKCDNCGSTFTTEEIDHFYEKKKEEAVSVEDQNTSETLQWSDSEAEHLRAYNCPACGAQLITDETTAATSCPYCGNPAIVPSQFKGSLKPDYVIPFQLTKEDAVSKLKDFYHGKPLLPKAFRSNNHIQEIKGVYVPFWLYDGNAHVHIRAHTTRVHTHTTSEERITVTEHYLVIRDGNVEYHNVPADASSKMPDDFMDSIEPYDFTKMVPFQMSYLPGYLADRYDVSSEDDEKRADERMQNTAIHEANATILGYSSILPEEQSTQIHKGTVRYALLPVWMLSTKYKDKNYLFAMNGQTGKMIGDDLPTDYGKLILYFIIIFVIGVIVMVLLTNAIMQ